MSAAADDGELIARIKEKALFAREETVRLTGIAKTGHYASAFSCAEILATLYYGGIMRLKPGEPQWKERDRFLFGKGHAAIALYPFLADYGFFDKSVLDEYTRLGNPLGDHPDMRKVPGIDFSSGSLGHALSAGLGMALGGRLNNIDYNVFVLLGDGEQHEGQVWEAALSAAHHRTGNLIAIVDRNEYSLDGKVDDVIGIEPVLDKWQAFGWNTIDIDGHDVPQVLQALRDATAASHDGKPTVIVAHTVKGKGIPYMETEFGWHLGYLHPSDEKLALAHLRSNA
ncbi:transketolase [Micromonospora rhizosphaerae]|uniref:Transketolase n=1 Tax=Micromonospora rhizosphaerae TaxID=568872 RepID=A0A1C6SYX7_9ACTN|nr:transketolase [Micromonospora rhizosphaerae]SCL34335.1 transketolase [Micromonospora rhizosphaerae]